MTSVDFIDTFAACWGANPELMRSPPETHLNYPISGGSGRDPACYTGQIEAIWLHLAGRWGNYVYQLMHIFHLAERINVKFVYLVKTEIFSCFEQKLNGITVLGQETPPEAEHYCLGGVFFNPAPLGALMDGMTPERRLYLVNTYIKPLMAPLPHVDAIFGPNDLAIHIRSGDIFEGREGDGGANAGGPAYIQPPLSFYLAVVNRLFGGSRGHIVIISENALNPVITALIPIFDRLGHGITLRLGHSLPEDLAWLFKAPQLVFANGTIGIAIALISDDIRAGFFFRRNSTGTMQDVDTYLGAKLEKYFLIDRDAKYIQIGNWRNTKAQRAEMLSFPIADILWSDGYDSDGQASAGITMEAPQLNDVRMEDWPPGTAMVDVALGKQARQSSYSQWSKPGEEANAVSAAFHGEFAFHTDQEPSPWWQVDLGASFPIETIIVSNRVGGFEERARTLKIEISDNEVDWITIHSGFVRFGSKVDGKPLTWCIGSDLHGRYVRLSLTENQYLHLSRVEVLVRNDMMAFADFCAKHHLPRYYLNENPAGSKYTIETNPAAIRPRIVGLKINYSGRFGNLLHQYVNVIQLALRTGLKFIQLGRHELFDVRETFSHDGINFIPPGAPLPTDGSFICGEFFNSDDFMPVLPPFLQFRPEDEREFTAVVQKYILPHMLTGIPLKNESHPADELTIHIRSGDIFELDHPMTYGYRQPPLSFYQLVVQRMRKSRRIKKVRLVFEDRGNPCINALEHWLQEQKIPCRVNCGTLHEDMSALIDAPHLVFGHGTFGYAACRLSKRIETLHFFRPELGGSYGAIPTIAQVFAVSDAKGEYIKAFEYGRPFGPNDGWRNTPEMRARMLEYPAEFLHIEELHSEGVPAA